MARHFIYANDGLIAEAVQDIVANGGAVVKTWQSFPRSILAEIPDAGLAAVGASPNIAACDSLAAGVTTQVGLPTSDPSAADYLNVWGVNRIKAPQVHAVGNTGQGVRIVIVDTGIDTDHPDLIFSGGARFVNGAGGAGSFEDDNGHGTHVAGTIVAQINAFGATGVAPAAEVFAAKVLDSAGNGQWADIADALQYCIDKTDGGTRKVVSNHSYGGSANPGAAVEAMYQTAADAGVILVTAAGNEGAGPDTVLYPARWDSNIAVSATAEINDDLAFFSSSGPSVEVAAPGLGIYSTTFDGGYGLKNGTSMAAPHVTGAMALALSIGVVDPRAVIPISTDRTTRTPEFGWGIIDCTKLVGETAPPVFGRTVLFDATGSFDPDGVIVSYLWDPTGDGTFEDLGGAVAPYTYAADGVYDVGLKVIDDQGAETVITQTIRVQSASVNQPPVANFTVVDVAA